MHRSRLTKIVFCLGTLITGAVSAPDQTCKRLIPMIAKETHVPPSLLMAIAFVESGFRPYAVNNGGESLQFHTPGESLAYVEKQIAQGNTNIDIGCMQVNWKAHRGKFESPRELLVPSKNIRFAATFLKSLYEELGTWAKAIAAYHSRNKVKSRPYLIKIATYLTIERQNDDQRHISTHPYNPDSIYHPPSSLVWVPFLQSPLSHAFYSNGVSSTYAYRFTGSASAPFLSFKLSNEDVKAGFLRKYFTGFVHFRI